MRRHLGALPLGESRDSRNFAEPVAGGKGTCGIRVEIQVYIYLQLLGIASPSSPTVRRLQYPQDRRNGGICKVNGVFKDILTIIP